MSRPGWRKKKNNYFAVYRGDQFLAHGPIWELARLFNMKETSLRLLSYRPHHKRVSEAKNPDEWLIAIKVEELEAEDLIVKNEKGELIQWQEEIEEKH